FAGIGFAIDSQLGTTPWITLGLFFIGFITGVYNAWRVMNVDGEKVGLKYKAPPKTELGSHDISMPGAKKADEEADPRL
ncbi:MAG: AtpZ/AtpI family protein, partial [Alphaproteobacteria bacterium]|nr:AtpZ/AtpI family protein [Alphaproteobacteria bacterium]